MTRTLPIRSRRRSVPPMPGARGSMPPRRSALDRRRGSFVELSDRARHSVYARLALAERLREAAALHAAGFHLEARRLLDAGRPVEGIGPVFAIDERGDAVVVGHWTA
jgi:hypothetical protein